MDWAKRWGEKFGLEPFTVQRKEKDLTVDICFDDCDVDLAKVNVKVKRINNCISRKDWNENKPGPDGDLFAHTELVDVLKGEE